ncbi:IPT/TIG domain-containing protein [Chloroflexota bacterium]
MKRNRTPCSIISILMVLLLLAAPVPAIPVLAADESISVSPDRGEIGDQIEIKGYDFNPGDYVYLFFSSYYIAEGNDMSDLDAYEYVGYDPTGNLGSAGEGAFETSIVVPSKLTKGDEDETVGAGTYYIFVSYDPGGSHIVDSDRFIVTGIELDLTEGNVGDEVDISGVGFRSRDDIEVFYDDDEVDIESGDVTTDLYGEFTASVSIPASTTGKHAILVEVANNEAEAMFTVLPAVTFAPTSGKAGDEVMVRGTGFGREKGMTIYFGSEPVTVISGNARSDRYGGFVNLRFMVPPRGAGTYDIRVRDSANTSATAKANFTVVDNGDITAVTWNCPFGGVTLISPYPINDRPFLIVNADPANITVSAGATLWGIYYFDETTGEWLYFIPGFTGNTLTQLEPDEYYYVIVSAPCNLTIPQGP